MIRSLISSLACATALAAPAVAQDEPAQNAGAIAEAVRDAYRALNGQEVRIEGSIGTYIADLIYFADDNGRYPVKLDAGREVRRRIEECELNVYDPSSSWCKVVGMAEISVDLEDNNLGDGIGISFVLYEVESLKTKEDY